jgi:hypothetical protein
MRFARHIALGSIAAIAGFGAFAAGCGDDPIIPPKGGWAIAFSPGTSGACPLATPHNGQVGTVSATSADGVVTHGVDGADVECTITGSGTFDVQAKASMDGSILSITIPAINANASKDDPASGTAAYAGPGTSSLSYAGACDFYFDFEDQTVDTGKIWVSFTCDEVTSGNQGPCTFSGTAVFQDCIGATEEE